MNDHRDLSLNEIRWIAEGLKCLGNRGPKLNKLREEIGKILKILEDAEVEMAKQKDKRTIIDDILDKEALKPLKKELPPDRLKKLVSELKES
ncbi:hypothetical protein ACFO25_19570 [Paenactinomyces guangxiensis]|uniref:Uncharacterized protein n=1 Tax=Paenactinomyces guangxiensis TaxID=1490290 RepID=A0A7W1WUX7_9BACL|nr:hypothetical protein [Paenactinomyces guangxiensis]MBA4496523.1 hypothetical protein [Paenactinomyces guangxiensis]MBH8593551.1 hypothetical protein [Paenactinomyces guangxiensis]